LEVHENTMERDNLKQADGFLVPKKNPMCGDGNEHALELSPHGTPRRKKLPPGGDSSNTSARKDHWSSGFKF